MPPLVLNGSVISAMSCRPATPVSIVSLIAAQPSLTNRDLLGVWFEDFLQEPLPDILRTQRLLSICPPFSWRFPHLRLPSFDQTFLDDSFPVLRDQIAHSARLGCTWSVRRCALHCCCAAVELMCPFVLIAPVATAAVNVSAVTRWLNSCLSRSASVCESAGVTVSVDLHQSTVNYWISGLLP